MFDEHSESEFLVSMIEALRKNLAPKCNVVEHGVQDFTCECPRSQAGTGNNTHIDVKVEDFGASLSFQVRALCTERLSERVTSVRCLFRVLLSVLCVFVILDVKERI